MRPISLDNFLIKVILGVLNDRLEGVLPKLISPNQFSFMKRRSIIVNVLLDQEVIIDIRKRDACKCSYKDRIVKMHKIE